MLVASSPCRYAASPALSQTRFRPRDMNRRSSGDNEQDAASTVAMNASDERSFSAASSRAPME